VRLGAGHETVMLSMSKNFAVFEMGPTTVFSRLIDGNFPNYEQVVPRDQPKKVNVKRTISLPPCGAWLCSPIPSQADQVARQNRADRAQREHAGVGEDRSRSRSPTPVNRWPSGTTQTTPGCVAHHGFDRRHPSPQHGDHARSCGPRDAGGRRGPPLSRHAAPAPRCLSARVGWGRRGTGVGGTAWTGSASP